MVGDWLACRLRIAMKNDEDFRVVVVLPVFPAGDLVRSRTSPTTPIVTN